MNNYNLHRVLDISTELNHRISELLDMRVIDDTAQYPKESGAVRRTSMELTRALADLRRSRD